jgi:hypothetical protein
LATQSDESERESDLTRTSGRIDKKKGGLGEYEPLCGVDLVSTKERWQLAHMHRQLGY